ncbi:MAG: calcium/sodium antiporter [bacterium]|nr:calcium/sodium antiporter [bacterium]
MLSIFLWSLVFIVSLTILVKSSDWFTESAVDVGIWLGLSPFIIGVTIVAIGTSLPELSTSIIAIFQGSSEIVLANVVGSNITNIFLILGIAILICRSVSIKFNILSVELPVFLASAFLLLVMVWDGNFSFMDGFLALAGYTSYILYTVGTRERKKKRQIQKENGSLATVRFPWKSFVILIASSFLIFVGAKFTVESVVVLATILGVSTAVISVTAVALGTSLPELAVTVVSARKGNLELAFGNIIGSNIFNALAVTGISSLFGTLIVTGNILTFGIPMMIIASVLFFVMSQKKQISIWEGVLLLVFYAFFLFRSFGIV